MIQNDYNKYERFSPPQRLIIKWVTIPLLNEPEVILAASALVGQVINLALLSLFNSCNNMLHFSYYTPLSLTLSVLVQIFFVFVSWREEIKSLKLLGQYQLGIYRNGCVCYTAYLSLVLKGKKS